MNSVPRHIGYICFSKRVNISLSVRATVSPKMNPLFRQATNKCYIMNVTFRLSLSGQRPIAAEAADLVIVWSDRCANVCFVITEYPTYTHNYN